MAPPDSGLGCQPGVRGREGILFIRDLNAHKPATRKEGRGGDLIVLANSRVRAVPRGFGGALVVTISPDCPRGSSLGPHRDPALSNTHRPRGHFSGQVFAMQHLQWLSEMGGREEDMHSGPCLTHEETETREETRGACGASPVTTTSGSETLGPVPLPGLVSGGGEAPPDFRNSASAPHHRVSPQPPPQSLQLSWTCSPPRNPPISVCSFPPLLAEKLRCQGSNCTRKFFPPHERGWASAAADPVVLGPQAGVCKPPDR